MEANPAGYVNGSQLEMLHLRLRFENKGEHLFVEEATAIQVKSLSPWEPWIRKPSWQLKIHFNRARDLGKASVASGQFGLNGGSGVSVKVPYVNRSEERRVGKECA